MAENCNTKNLKQEIEDVEQVARQSDALPQLNSINECLEETFEKLLYEFKDAKNSNTSLKLETVECSKMEALESKRNDQQYEIQNLEYYGSYARHQQGSEQQKKSRIADKHHKTPSETSCSYREAPGLYDSKTLQAEVNMIRESANKLRERLQLMEQEVVAMREMVQSPEQQELTTCHLEEAISNDSMTAQLIEDLTDAEKNLEQGSHKLSQETVSTTWLHRR